MCSSFISSRQQRMAEIHKLQQASKFGDVKEISAQDYVDEVNKAGKGVWVVLHLYKSGYPFAVVVVVIWLLLFFFTPGSCSFVCSFCLFMLFKSKVHQISSQQKCHCNMCSEKLILFFFKKRLAGIDLYIS